ncbi:MAG: ThiF family adenylyltransferase [Syntrophales bacterium]|nr:ThiF family adenylyltransferase [Syntrophales bacterium]
MRDNEHFHSRFLRQLDIVSPEKLSFPITVIGAGAIGSAAVVSLAKMGCSSIAVWEDDRLEEMNIPNQLCKPALVGKLKVDALEELVLELTGVRIEGIPKRYGGQFLKGVVIVAVDTMTARQVAWKRARLNPRIPLLVDARMGAEFARMYAIHPMDIGQAEFYEQNLYGADEAERLPCSARSIIYCPTVIAGIVALIVKQYAMNQPVPQEILFDLPSLILKCHKGGDFRGPSFLQPDEPVHAVQSQV